MKIKDEDEIKKEIKNKTRNEGEHKGPEKKRYNPTEGSERKFKEGKRPEKANICKKRYQQISVTALGDVNTTTSARILQTAPVYTMTLQVGTSDFTSSSALTKFGSVAFALVALFALAF